MWGELAEVGSGCVVWCEEMPAKEKGGGGGHVEGPGTCGAQMHVKARSTEALRPSRRWDEGLLGASGERWARAGPVQEEPELRCA